VTTKKKRGKKNDKRKGKSKKLGQRGGGLENTSGFICTHDPQITRKRRRYIDWNPNNSVETQPRKLGGLGTPRKVGKPLDKGGKNTRIRTIRKRQNKYKKMVTGGLGKKGREKVVHIPNEQFVAAKVSSSKKVELEKDKKKKGSTSPKSPRGLI